MRLRTVNARHYFALKQPGENAQSCLEFETEVADRAAMHGAILRMGYHATVRVAKPGPSPGGSLIPGTAPCASMISKEWVDSWNWSAWRQMTRQRAWCRLSWPRLSPRSVWGQCGLIRGMTRW